MGLSSHLSKDVVAAVALAGAVGILAVRRIPPLLLERASFSDGHAIYDDVGELRHAVWSPPERLGGAINTPARESRPALSPDGRWLVFAVGEPGLSCDLWIAPLESGEPLEARPLTALNTTYDELAPAFGPDGLYFASDRSGGAGGYDLWLAPFADGVSGAPTALAGAINTPADELDPAPVALGGGARAVAFASDRAQGERSNFDLYLAHQDGAPSGAEVERLDALCSASDDREPAFASDGRSLYLASDRGEPGRFAIYRTLREDGAWLPPRKVEGLGDSSVRAPAPSVDGFTLYFEASPPIEASPAGQADADDRDLFRARSIELLQRPPPDLGWADLVLVGLLVATAILAFLAKRWNALDVLYKCFLASIIAHLILMWILGYIYPDPGDAAAPGKERDGGPTFHVRVLGDERLAARSAERAGELDARRATALAAEAPERLQLELGPERASSAPAAQVERAEAVLAEAPERAAEVLARNALLEPSAATELRAPLESFERLDGAAPSVELVARSDQAQRSLAQDAVLRERDAAAITAAAAPRSAAPGEAGVAAPRAAVAEAPGFAAAELERESAEAGSASSVALAAPSETFERLQGSPAQAPALPQAAGFAPSAAAATASGPSGRSTAAEIESTAVARAAPGPVLGLARPGGDLPAADAPSSAAGALERGPAGAGSASSVELAAPSESFERFEGSAAQPLALPRVSDFAPGPAAAPSSGPSSRASAVAVESSAATSAAPGPAPTIERRESAMPAADTPSGAPNAPRSQPASAVAGGPDLNQPAERFEPASGSASSSSAPAVALPSAASFAAPSAGAREVAGPARWTAPPEEARSSARAPEAPPAVALAPRPREDVQQLPEPPRRLDDTVYRSRFGPEREIALAEHGGGADTELAVARGLAYLASIQNGDGSWGDPDHRSEKYRQVAIGKTGLALLAFLGAGHTPQGGEHAGVARAAIDFLLARQKSDTGHFGEGCSYSHGIATYALAECFALTRDERLRRPLERAVQQILRNQYEGGDERASGGWSYYYHDGATFDRWPRASITSWQVMALESARLGGLEVPDASFDAARAFLLRSWDPGLGAFRYSHDPERLSSGYPTLPGSTPAALFALGLLGEDIGAAPFDDARRYLLDRSPSGFRYRGDEAFVMRAVGNVYFWYYGSLALFRLGGAEWERWNTALKETLLPSQEGDGSWPPLDVYAKNYAGDDDQDRSYTTAMCVLSLEVYYRYFTPLLQVK